MEVIEGHGTLNFKVEWQSMDGRCCHKFHTTFKEAESHAEHLYGLGRVPQIWGKADKEFGSIG